MKRLLFLSFLILASLMLMAQKPIAKFKTYTHDFGTIYEKEGKVSHTFEFTNTGSSDLLLLDVKASCGCTTPKYSKKPIPPKGTGYILVSYNPKARPGPFNKTITVSNNSAEDKIQLTIKGDVIPIPVKKTNKK